MRIDYCIFNPTGNITAIVTSAVNTEDYNRVNNEIMEKHPNVEQVGFLDFEREVPHLRMCGGEFCGNATMCAATLFCINNNIDNKEVFISVYGVSEPLKVSVLKTDNGYSCELSVLKPKGISEKIFTVDNKEYNLPIVSLNGISHILSFGDFDNSVAEKILRKYTALMNLPAMGFMIYKRNDGILNPIVYVEKCKTLFYENSCASGSIAVCAYETADTADYTEITLNQKGGVLKAASSKNNNYISLSGNVKLLKFFTEEF